MSQNIKVDAIALAAEVVELRNEVARLKNQTNWVCSCGGTDCEGQRENAELKATLTAVSDANERGRKDWQEAHPDKEMVWPDQAKLVEWLLRENDELRAHAERLGDANDLLVVENAALRKDKERLDFINANHLVRFGHSAKMGGHGPGWYWVLGEVASHYRIKNIRDTIDSAIAWYKKPRGPKQNIHIQETQP